MRCTDWLGTNFKMNSDGQLRHFNCTIPGHRERERELREASEKRALARGWRGGDGEKEEKDGQRMRRVWNDGGGRGMDGHKK